ncbi:MAG TPA: methyltransferase domain-containing protein [Jatrophihabitans sp.]|nr:methyltransferase domain-containing protein [Jatrophihabitans sp.]
MIEGALTPYETALAGSGQLSLVTADGAELALAIQRYLADADEADATVLDRCVPPVLDVGCGPGRIVHALASQGKAALGVDIAEMAVAITEQRGAPALSRSVFQRLPGEGRWPTVLVLDGNVGIGGDVCGLLARLADLMAPGGCVIAEPTGSHAEQDDVLAVRFATESGATGPEFPWAVVGRSALLRHAAVVGLTEQGYWSAGDRVFVRLVRSAAMV